MATVIYPAAFAHGAAPKPKTAGSISKPLSRRELESTQKWSAGMRPRAFQFDAAESEVKPTSPTAAAGPPAAAITSSTEESLFIDCDNKSRSVSTSSAHNLCLGETCGLAPTENAMYSQIQAAKRLKQTQEALEMTNAVIAEKMGVASNAWAQYRSAKRAIPHNVLVKLKEHFGVTTDWILAGDPSGLPQRIYAKIRIVA